MVKPSATRTCSQRSIATLKQDLVRFEEAGKAPGKAKECNNVIDSVFFEIPLERVRTISAIRKIFLQISNDCYWDILKYMFFFKYFKVCVPGLHITLAVYLKLYNLFEVFCRRIDISQTESDQELVKQLEESELAVTSLQSKKDSVEQAFDWELISKNLVQTDLLVKL